MQSVGRRLLKHDAFGLFERTKKMHARAKETDGACETVRMHSSFLFAGTAEGALCRLLLLAHFSDTHTPLLYKSPYVPGKHQQHMYIVCLCKHKHVVKRIVLYCSSQILQRPLFLTENVMNLISKCSTITSKRLKYL